jgi:hypothetical protein
MKKIISIAEKIIKKLKKEEKVVELDNIFSEEQMIDHQKRMEEIHQEYMRKAAASWNSAKDIILD